MPTYREFLQSKQRIFTGDSIAAKELPTALFDWQTAITRWALKKGRAAVFADCGLGKTFMQLSWAAAVPGRVLILAPLCVAEQTVSEGVKLGVPVVYSRTPIDAPITITNYERLENFDPSDYAGVVLDESSILKAFDGKTRQRLIETFQDTTYRLCCTATPSPNDIAELANHAEFLGLMTRAEFLATWFVHDDEGWRMKGHAVQPFFRWLASWALAVNTPSDISYADDGFVLPPLTIHDHILQSETASGALFPELSAKGIGGRLSARRASLDDRVAEVADLATTTDGAWLIWCGLNDESDALAAAIPGAVNVEGSDSYDDKRDAILWFTGTKCFCEDVLSHKLSAWRNARQIHPTSERITSSTEHSESLNQRPINGSIDQPSVSISASTCANTRDDQTSFNSVRNAEKNSSDDGENNMPPMRPCVSDIGPTLESGRGGIASGDSINDLQSTVLRETPTTDSSWLSRTPALFAEPPSAILPASAGSISTTVMERNESEDCSARNAIKGSASSMIKSNGSDVPRCICGRPLGKRVLISKVKILGWGLNFQHCHQVAFVGLSDSYEQYYQAIRRCWRFGQLHAVDVHIVVSEAEAIVVENVRRKQAAARDLSQALIAHMRDFEREELIA